MRTTLDLDDDVLKVAKELAAHRRQSIGRIISDHFRKSLIGEDGHQTEVNGLRVISRKGTPVPVTLDLVNKLRDESY